MVPFEFKTEIFEEFECVETLSEIGNTTVYELLVADTNINKEKSFCYLYDEIIKLKFSSK